MLALLRRAPEKSLSLDSLRLEITKAHLGLIQLSPPRNLLASNMPLFQSIFQMLPHQPTNQSDPVLHLLYCFSDVIASAQLISVHKIANEATAKVVLKPFNESLLSPSDPLCMWDDLFGWRSTFASVLLRAEPSDSLKKLLNPSNYTLHLVSIARRQNIPTMAAEYLKLVSVDPRNLQGMLSRWVERAELIIALKMKNSSVFTDLDGIATDSLSAPQASGVFNLQGKYRLVEDKPDEAMALFWKAVQADRSNVFAWKNLSDLYFKQWTESRDAKAAQNCVACCRSVLLWKHLDFKSIDRILRIVLSALDENQTALLDANSVLSISDSAWLWYLPLLFSYPSEAQFSFFAPVIFKLISKYPQIVFYPLTVLAMNAGMQTTDYNLMQTTLLSGSIEGSAVSLLHCHHAKAAAFPSESFLHSPVSLQVFSLNRSVIV